MLSRTRSFAAFSNQVKTIIKLFIALIFLTQESFAQQQMNREDYWQQLLKVLPADQTLPASDQLPGTLPARISPEDFTWRDWQQRTGELPPDFEELPSFPFLPDPLSPAMLQEVVL